MILIDRDGIVEVIAEVARSRDEFAVRSVANVNKTDLVIFAIQGTAGNGFIAVFEPMATDELRMAESFADVIFVGVGASLLIAARNETGVEKAAVEGAEMEFADQ